MNIIFLGPQACGKGTQAIMLVEKLKIPHISTGDIFRKSVKEKDEIGKMLKKHLDSGGLVPDELTNKIVENRLKQADAKKGFILDGYPRTIAQAKFLDKISKINKVVEIKISDSEAINRIVGRRSCACGQTYHLIHKLSKKDGICDLCGKKLFQREDDKPDVVKKRLKLYHKKIKPLLDYYKGKKILIVVNGERSIQEIHSDIAKIFSI
ncbi:MAG: adenylate kinase [Patescibacteria group bacterium]|nr:adenylate kinase [Patescibacteria group bacterium]